MKRNRWADEDLRKLEAASETAKSRGELYDLFPEYTTVSVDSQMKYPGLKIGGWSWDRQEEILEDMASKGKGALEIAQALGRTEAAVRNHLHLRGLVKKRTRKTGKRETNPVTLCERCEHSKSDYCEYIRTGKPIEGWDATPTEIKVHGGNGDKIIHGFFVKTCPKFEEEKVTPFCKSCKSLSKKICTMCGGEVGEGVITSPRWCPRREKT